MKATLEDCEDGGSTPRLALFSGLWDLPEPQGTKTPPLIGPVSIPFKWEEAPGKPKAEPGNRLQLQELTASRSLHLPPRFQRGAASPGRGSDSTPSKQFYFFRGASLKSRSYSSRADFSDFSKVSESPTSILNSPRPRSRGSSTSSQDADDVARVPATQADVERVPAPQDDVARALAPPQVDVAGSRRHGEVSLRRLLEQWTPRPSLRWQQKPQESAPLSTSSSSSSFREYDSTYSSARLGKGAPAATGKRRWVLRKMKKSSRLFGTFLKRFRISLKKGR